MYVAPGLLFLHLPRAAGTFVTNVLERGGSGSRNVLSLGPHDGVRKVGNLVEGRLTFGCIRDPFSWYVSLFNHFKHHKSGTLTGPLADMCGNKATFKDALSAMTKPTGQAVLCAPKFPGHPTGVPRLGQQLLDAGIGLWSWYIMQTFCTEEVEQIKGLSKQLDDSSDLPWTVNALVDTACVEEGLTQILQAWGGSKKGDLSAFLATAPPINEGPLQTSWRGIRPSGRPDPRWYDADAQAIVREVDGFLIRRFGLDEPVGRRKVVHVLRE